MTYFNIDFQLPPKQLSTEWWKKCPHVRIEKFDSQTYDWCVLEDDLCKLTCRNECHIY